MSNNVEKFNTPKSMKDLDLEEGLHDYEQEKRNTNYEETKATEKKRAKERRLWQQRINDLFESDNFSEVKVLLQARPELKPSAKIVQAKLNKLIAKQPKNWESVFSNIRSISDIQPDPNVIENESNVLLANLGRDINTREQIKTLKRKNCFSPTHKFVQKKYRAILESHAIDNLSLFSDVQSLTGIMPERALFDEVLKSANIDNIKEAAILLGVELSSEIIQSIYKIFFDKHGYFDTRIISQLPEKPNAETIQKIYSGIIDQKRDGWLNTLNKLEKETGIKPIFSNEQAQAIFETFFSRGWYGQSGNIGVESMIELTKKHPSPEIIQKEVLGIIDYGISYGANSESIKQKIQKLETATGTKIIIPENEIQSRYQQAIQDRKYSVITKLYAALGIKPDIDKETARKFIASFIDETDLKTIEGLASTFGIAFEAKKKEVTEKFDEALENLDFNRIKTIQETTGKQPNQKKLKAALLKKIEQEALRSPKDRYSDYVQDLLREIKNSFEYLKTLFEQFDIAIPKKTVLGLYKKMINNEIIHVNELENLHKISGTSLPSELAQKAYKIIIDPGYNDSIDISKPSNYSSNIYSYGIADSIKKIYEISSQTPINITEEQIQTFYRNQIEDPFERIFEIQKIEKLTGVAPQFDITDINQLYKKWILDGQIKKAKKCHEITKVEMQFDKETLQYVSENISEPLAQASSENYMFKEYSGEMEFKRTKLETDLKKVSELIEGTDISPDPIELQNIYVKILESDPYCFDIIDEISKATKIKPHFTPEQIQEKGIQLLESGALRGFEILLKYGEFSYDQATTEKGFQAILDYFPEYSKFDKKYFHQNEQHAQLLLLKKLSGFDPNKEHLAQLFSNFVESRHRRFKIENEATKLLNEEFETEIDESLTQKIYTELLKKKNIETIEALKEKTKIIPQISAEIIQETVDYNLKRGNYKDLSKLKRVLEINSLPATEAIVQDLYAQLLSDDNFIKQDSNERRTLATLYSLTGVHPQTTEEQSDYLYGKTTFSNWSSFSKALGKEPSLEAVQNKYYQFLANYQYNLQEDLGALEQFSGIKVEEETIKKALDDCARKTKINEMIKINEVTGLSPKVSPEAVQQGYRTILEKHEKKESFHDGQRITTAINYFHGTLDIAPDNETLAVAYQNLFMESAYNFGYEKEGKMEYPNWWDVLRNKFGPPSIEAIQRTYYSQINRENLSQATRHLEYIQSFSEISPNIDTIAKVQEIESSEVEQKLQAIYQAKLHEGDIESLKALMQQWDVPFQISAIDAQIIYAKFLFGYDELPVQKIKFMFEHSKHKPNKELIQNKYQELLLKDLKDTGYINVNRVFDLLDLTEIEPTKDIVAQADTEWSQTEMSYLELVRYVQLLNSQDFENLFPKSYLKIVEQIGENLAGDVDLADYFLENLHEYYSKKWAAEYTINAVQHYSVAKKFEDTLKQGIAVWVSEPWIKTISQHAQTSIDQGPPPNDWDDDNGYSYGQENQGFYNHDPFENHPLRKIRSSLGLGQILAEKITPTESGLKLSAEAIEVLREINVILVNEHNNFLEKFKQSSTVPKEDKIALTDQSQSKIKMNNLLPNVRNFVGRYLAQLANGNTENLSEYIIPQKDSIKRMVQEGYRRYLKIYDVDIPLYDKLYEEFDHWREAGRYPMEVYLGRDGIYAYIGRQTQDATRRSKVGRKKREKLREKGEIIEINPKYLVYPRYFRDNINYDTKRAFLEQEQISPEKDPLFYDTGYTGTIPEQIMQVMDFSQSDIEQRIRLLSAPSANRRVKGIPENARGEVIEYIEHNAKTENTAEGLIQDEKTGRIRHIARPTSPEEQFYFMMIKQAISRHYMIQERLQFEAPENANYDSQNYYIRVRQEYIDILPTDFLKNPEQYIKQQEKLLNKGKVEGESPDKEVLSFNLKDGTEIIAKRVEIKNTKESRKEFMILIASKKAGLPTAEPVGFLSGKKEEDGSYLLMEKLEGYPGSKFDKYLKETGKFTDKQITVIMKSVAKKLKDLAQMFRDQLNIDKRWQIKDTIIQFNEETGLVESVIPIDWERVKTYDPKKPQKIDLIE